MRAHERVALKALASVTDGCVETRAVGVDISSGGIGLRTGFIWSSGTRVSVRIRKDDGTTAVARAVVQRTGEDVMGLRVLASGPAFSRLTGVL